MSGDGFNAHPEGRARAGIVEFEELIRSLSDQDLVKFWVQTWRSLCPEAAATLAAVQETGGETSQ